MRTARDLIAKWDRSDALYASDPRASARAHEMADGIRAGRALEVSALPLSQRPKARAALEQWRPPIVIYGPPGGSFK